MTRFGHDVLSVFNVWEDTQEFLAAILESGTAPEEETRQLFNQSLTGGAEDWNHLIDCARSIQHARHDNLDNLDGSDVLAYVWEIFNSLDDTPLPPEPWEETDRLISLAKKLEADIEILLPPSLAARQDDEDRTVFGPRAKRHRPGVTSHYWSDEPPTQEKKDYARRSRISEFTASFSIDQSVLPVHQGATTQLAISTKPGTDVRCPGALSDARVSFRHWGQSDACYGLDTNKATVRKKQSVASPYFLQPTCAKKASPKKRPPPGTVSCIPFPPLTSPCFGIIQERLAHEPFWLLIAITFLIKTNGQLAIPVFWRVKERFPTPLHLVDACSEEELLDMIRHLGLSKVRVAYIQRYARAFLAQPPRAGVRYRVKNYDRRDMSPPPRDLYGSSASGLGMAPLTPDKDDQDLEAWEIGHMTKGKYGIDSWRIFCRDELLGWAEDWNGKGREPEFQPEWMRARPDDKELRACLRWMWMREGWEWDPATGERTVLRDEMRRAVNEGRVEYDETGALRMLEEEEEPRDGGGEMAELEMHP